MNNKQIYNREALSATKVINDASLKVAVQKMKWKKSSPHDWYYDTQSMITDGEEKEWRNAEDAVGRPVLLLVLCIPQLVVNSWWPQAPEPVGDVYGLPLGPPLASVAHMCPAH